MPSTQNGWKRTAISALGALVLFGLSAWVTANSNRMDKIESLVSSINTDRDKRTVILQNIHEQLAEIGQRLRRIERKLP